MQRVIYSRPPIDIISYLLGLSLLVGLIDARRRQQIVNVRSVREAYEEVYSPVSRGFEDELNNNLLEPLEVGSPQRNSSNPDESFSFNDENNSVQSAAANNNGGYFSLTDPNSKKSKRISWLLYLSGMLGMSFLNPICCVLAMKYANPSILAPFSGLTLVWVVLFYGVILGEYPGKSQKIACALIVIGEVVVAMWGDHLNEEGKGVDDVLSSYREPAFRTFILLMTLFLIQLGVLIWICPKTSLLRKMAWGSIGGSITGFQNFLKDALTIYDATKIQQEQTRTNVSLPVSFFLFVVLAMLTAFVGLLFLAACMKRYDATYSAAMFVVSFVISASLMSSVHYHTIEHLEGVSNYIMYPLGLMTLFLGAFILIEPAAAAGGYFCGHVGEINASAEEAMPTYSDLNDAGSERMDGGCRERLLNAD